MKSRIGDPPIPGSTEADRRRSAMVFHRRRRPSLGQQVGVQNHPFEDCQTPPRSLIENDHADRFDRRESKSYSNRNGESKTGRERTTIAVALIAMAVLIPMTSVFLNPKL